MQLHRSVQRMLRSWGKVYQGVAASSPVLHCFLWAWRFVLQLVNKISCAWLALQMAPVFHPTNSRFSDFLASDRASRHIFTRISSSGEAVGTVAWRSFAA